MTRTITMAVLAATTAITASAFVLTQPASAQVEFHIGQQPQRGGAYGDRDRDGIPNRYDNNNNYRNQAQVPNRRDQDNDGIPNRYDTDRDGDGRPNQWDRQPANPHR